MVGHRRDDCTVEMTLTIIECSTSEIMSLYYGWFRNIEADDSELIMRRGKTGPFSTNMRKIASNHIALIYSELDL